MSERNIWLIQAIYNGLYNINANTRKQQAGNKATSDLRASMQTYPSILYKASELLPEITDTITKIIKIGFKTSPKDATSRINNITKSRQGRRGFSH